MITEQLSIADVAAQSVHGFVPARFHHLEQIGPAFCRRREEPGTERVQNLKPFYSHLEVTHDRLRAELN